MASGFSGDGGGMEFYGGAGRSILGDTGTVIKSDNKFFNRRIRTGFPDSRNIPRLNRRLVIWWKQITGKRTPADYQANLQQHLFHNQAAINTE
ncbi:hypothetical protein F2Q69_00060251 [Brassica cretica]|uniref:Uncharacterized protein n=1 Tax=Brassica cretica TaxID=69181 RepID=A0A8S9RET0_BRACR|nr:hypothetical protein F2Q69_00060251 [Brassica cretica]